MGVAEGEIGWSWDWLEVSSWRYEWLLEVGLAGIEGTEYSVMYCVNALL